jgi:hypothetical protein
MNTHDVICQVRESFSELRMDMPVEEVFARNRVRRRRHLAAMTAVAATAGAVAAVTTLAVGGPGTVARPGTVGGPAPAGASHQPSPGQKSVTLAAFSVASGPGDSTTLILYSGPKYPSLDPTALHDALAQHGIPSLVTIGSFCRSTPAPAGLGEVVQPLSQADGSGMVIDGQAMPSGTELSIGSFQGAVKIGLIEDGAPLSCGSSTSQQPAVVHLTPSGS